MSVGIDHAYGVLKCSKFSSTEEIKQSYIALVKQWHPDVNKSVNLDGIKSINNAYDLVQKYHVQVTDHTVEFNIQFAPAFKEPFIQKNTFYRTMHQDEWIIYLPIEEMDIDTVIYLMVFLGEDTREFKINIPKGQKLPVTTDLNGKTVKIMHKEKLYD